MVEDFGWLGVFRLGVGWVCCWCWCLNRLDGLNVDKVFKVGRVGRGNSEKE